MELINYYNKNTIVCIFLIKIFEYGLNSSYNKFIPEIFNESISYLKSVINKYYPNKIQELIYSSKNEAEFINKIGIRDYNIFYTIIFSNKLKLSVCIEQKYYNDDNNFFNFSINDNIKYYLLNIDHNHNIEKHISNSKTTYLFHGSALSNWYSILYNGIKVMSNTKYQKHGAALGNGIYLSSSLKEASSYSRNSDLNIIGIGVFEVVNYEKFKKNSTVYVVSPTSNNIILRYIIITDFGNLSYVEKFFKSKFFLDKHANININKIGNKRLDKEVKLIKKNFPNDTIELIDNKIVYSPSNKSYQLELDCSIRFPLYSPKIQIYKDNNIIDITNDFEWNITKKLYEIISYTNNKLSF